MSDRDLRRPRRIIAGPELPPVPPAAPLPQQAERFQRNLSQGRRGETAPPRGPALPTGASAAPALKAPAGEARPTPPAAAPRTQLEPAPTFEPVEAGEAVENAAGTAWSEEPPAAEPPSDLPPGRDRPAALPAWETELAQLVATLCRKADPAFENWSVMVPLNPAVLPHTELRLSLSPLRLSLRFQSASTESTRLVLTHTPQLRRLLEPALPTPREIEIDVL
ncbi:type III secretion HpaP family protein [Aquabacterium sp. A7-Y]|uniref:type III secretion HpaP family protein n=1 Tax=Aquabacterium sp. A7-Y TaxID=1349605 RepID=UPI00223CBCA9|nr:type III secretion HpaP family protein [Aquabacterium sp. A7-Y]MCW7540806.1 type III secretion HpaP family protein [Aquabacterium sp. A7-Y]